MLLEERVEIITQPKIDGRSRLVLKNHQREGISIAQPYRRGLFNIG